MIACAVIGAENLAERNIPDERLLRHLHAAAMTALEPRSRARKLLAEGAGCRARPWENPSGTEQTCPSK